MEPGRCHPVWARNRYGHLVLTKITPPLPGRSRRRKSTCRRSRRDAERSHPRTSSRAAQSSEYPAPGEVSGSQIPGALAKHGAELRKMFGERGPQRAPMIERPTLPGEQDVSLRPGDLSRLTGRRNRPDPGALLRAGQRAGILGSSSAKHEITGSASLHVKLAAGLVPAKGAKTTGDLFKEVRLDRAPLPLASTMG